MTNEEFSLFIDQYADAVYGFCAYLADNTFDRDDLFQETFLLAFRQKEKIDAGDNVKNYFLSLAVGIHRNNLRKRKIRQLLTGDRSMNEEDTPEIADQRIGTEESVLQAEEAAFLRKQIMMLSEKLRIPVILFYLEGLTQEEIARCMKLPVGTVKSRLAAARKKLKERMEAAGYDR